MTQRPRIRDVMARDLVTLSPALEISRAAVLLLDRGISGAPVVDASGALVGVLSKKDCLRATLQASYFRDWSGTVETYMSRDPQTLDADLDLLEAAERFLASTYRRFPVLSAGALVGQVSRADLLRGLVAQWR